MPKLSVICEILLGSLCNRMPQIFPTLRIPCSNVGERVSRKAICFIRPEIRSVIMRVRILRAVPKFLPAALFKHHNFSWRFFHFIHFHFCQKLTRDSRHLPNGCPPIYPDPALTVPRGSFLMSKVGGTFPWKVERSWQTKCGESFGNPSFDLWLWGEGWEAATTILVPWKMSDFLFVFLMAWPMRKGKAATKYEGSVNFRGSMCVFFRGCC